MEWIVGIIVLIVIWKLLTRNKRIKATIEKEIVRAHLSSISNSGDGFLTYRSLVSYGRYRDYAIAKGGKEDNPGKPIFTTS